MSAFQILSEPVRRWLIETLFVGEQTSGDLAEIAYDYFGISWSAVSRHLVTLRRSGFVRVIPDEAVRWYALEDDWLELIEREVADLRTAWEKSAEYRRYGFASLIPAEGDWPPACPDNVRGRRGTSEINTAKRGIGRSIWAEETDGGAGMA